MSQYKIQASREPYGAEYSYGPFAKRETAEQMAIALAGNSAIMAVTIVGSDVGDATSQPPPQPPLQPVKKK